MIGPLKAAGWGARILALGCLYVIVDSVTSISSLFLAEVREGDPLDRFTVARVVQLEQQAAIVYSYWHSISSTQLTAIHLNARNVPTIGAVFFRDPGGKQVFLSDLRPTQIDVRWNVEGKPTVYAPGAAVREADWNHRSRCLSREKAARRVCWNREQIDVD